LWSEPGCLCSSCFFGSNREEETGKWKLQNENLAIEILRELRGLDAQRGPVAATKTGFSVFSDPSKP
jgi:hypothetical protein